MKLPSFTRKVNLGRLKPVVDPHSRRAPSGIADPDELPPACPDTCWFQDTRTSREPARVYTRYKLAPLNPTNEFPEIDTPHDRGEVRRG